MVRLTHLSLVLGAKKGDLVDQDDDPPEDESAETYEKSSSESGAYRYAEILAAIFLAHKALNRLWGRGTLGPARREHDLAIGKVVTGLRRVLGTQTSRVLSPHEVDKVGEFLGPLLSTLSDRIAAVIMESTSAVVADAASVVDRIVRRATGTDPNLSGSSWVKRVEANRVKQLREFEQQAGQALREDLSAAVIDRLKSIPRDAMRVADVLAEVSSALDDKWWMIERDVKTRTAYVFNQAQKEAIQELADSGTIPDVQSRWTELVDETTGDPLDDRVGNDSLVLHGQLAGENGAFTMPNDPTAPQKMVGQSWDHPPNRPRDRAIILPWAPGWGIDKVYKVSGTAKIPVDPNTGLPK